MEHRDDFLNRVISESRNYKDARYWLKYAYENKDFEIIENLVNRSRKDPDYNHIINLKISEEIVRDLGPYSLRADNNYPYCEVDTQMAERLFKLALQEKANLGSVLYPFMAYNSVTDTPEGWANSLIPYLPVTLKDMEEALEDLCNEGLVFKDEFCTPLRGELREKFDKEVSDLYRAPDWCYDSEISPEKRIAASQFASKSRREFERFVMSWMAETGDLETRYWVSRGGGNYGTLPGDSFRVLVAEYYSTTKRAFNCHSLENSFSYRVLEDLSFNRPSNKGLDTVIEDCISRG